MRVCSSCFSLDTLRYALAACKFLLHSNEKARCNVHIKQEGPVTLAGGALIGFLGFGETRSTPSCSCSLYIIPETELATELPLRSGLLFFLLRQFAHFTEDFLCFWVKFGRETAACLSWVQGVYISSPLGAAGSRNRIWCLPGFSCLDIRAQRHCLPTGMCEGTPQCLWSPLCPQILLLTTSFHTHTTPMIPKPHSAAPQVFPREQSPASGNTPLAPPSPDCLHSCSPDWLFSPGQSSPRFSKDIPLVQQ